VGQLDEIDLFNRALTGPEIQAIFNAGGSGKCTHAAITVFPSHGTNSGPINVAMSGDPLLSGAQVALSGSGLPAILGTNVANPSAAALTATFDLTSAAPGPRDVVITPRSGASVTLGGAFTILPTATTCSYTVAPLNPSFPASGGGGGIVVTSNPNTAQCNFSSPCGLLASPVSWVTPGVAICHIFVPPPGVPAETLAYQVAANPSANPRSTTVSIFGQDVTISQAGIGACSYSFSPTSGVFPMGGGSIDIHILTSAGCGWSASSSVSWVHVTAGSPGTGIGFVTIRADPNTGASRSGIVIIAGLGYNVSQGGDGCGANDVSGQVSVYRGPFLSGFFGLSYDETVIVRNPGATSIPGPVYLVLDGLPATRFECGNFFGQTQTCGISNIHTLTFCHSASGSDMVLFAPDGIGPGQSVSGELNFIPGLTGGASSPGWYTTRVFSGTPNM